MEVVLKIIGVDGALRTVVVKPGEAVQVEPGETVIVAPDQDVPVTTEQQGNTLVLHTPAGDILLHGFFAPSSLEQAPTALGYQDAQGLHILTAQAEQISQSFTMRPVVGGHVPEILDLPEQLTLPGNAQWRAAFQAIFAEADALTLVDSTQVSALELPSPIAPHQIKLNEESQDETPPGPPPDDLLAPVVGAPLTALNRDPVYDPQSPVRVSEGEQGGFAVVTDSASDADGNVLSYAITQGNIGDAFAINARDGKIRLTAPSLLDFETRDSYQLTVEVRDGQGGVVSQTITVAVTNANEAPIILAQRFAVTENSVNGTLVGTVAARDPDAGQTKSYAIVGGTGASAFQINPTTGRVTVADSAQLDREATATLTLEVQVTDNGTPALQSIGIVTISLNGLNDFAPIFTSNPNFTVSENTTTIGNVVASDADAGGPALRYSLVGGADQAQFAINASTGALRFLTAPDFETPADVGGDNVYNVDVRVSDSANTTTQNAAITVVNANDGPVITSSASANAAENQTAITTVTASDAEGDLSTFAIVGGVDAAKFVIDANTGVLSFQAAPNFELPTDGNTDNIYVVQVRANDGNGGLTTQTLNVTVTGVNDLAPVFSSATGVSVVENLAPSATVIDVNATDADAPAEPVLSYSLSGGADRALFAINASTGVVTFISSPDFERPLDADLNNIYVLQVTASDSGLSSVQTVAVTVTPVNDNSPSFTSLASASFAENGAGTVLTVQATDADVPGQAVSYSLVSSADQAKFTINASTGVLRFVTAPDADVAGDVGSDNIYNVTVRASDGTLTTDQALAITVTGINDNTPVLPASAAVNFVENGTGTVIDVNASDADRPLETLIYTLTGGVDQSKFAIDSASGVLTFITPPDFEAPTDTGANNTYGVQVTASDGSNVVNQSITVTVTDIGTTAFTSLGAVSFAENGVGTVLDVDATSEQTVTFSLTGGADQGLFAINASTGVLTFLTPPDADIAGDAGGNNVYDVK